jgi:O-antigen/teichoic acid export membrane protein
MTSETSIFHKFQEIGKQGAIYGIGSIMQRLMAIVLIPLYTTALSSAEYGVLSMLLMTGQVLSIIFALNLTSGLFRSYYDFTKEEERYIIISTVFLITTISSGLLLLFGILFSGYFSELLFDSDEFKMYFLIVVLSTIFEMFNRITFAVFRAKKEAAKYIVFQLIFFLMKVSIIVYLVALKGWGIRGVLVGELIVVIIAAIILSWLIRNCLVLRFSLPETQKMIHYGIPLAFAGLSGFVLTFIDRYFLAYYTNLSQVGLYTLASQFGMLMTVILITPLKLVWGPMFLSVKDHSNFKDFCAKALTYLVFIGGFIFLWIALLSKEMLYLISNSEYWSAYTVVPLIAFSYLIWSTRSILEIGVLLKRKTISIALYIFIGAMINVALNFVLIPKIGMIGAALATLISYSVVIVIDYFYNRRLLKINYEWKRILKIFLVIGVVFLFGYFYNIDDTYISIIFKSGIIISYPFILIFFGFYTKEEIIRIKQFVDLLPKPSI